MSTRYYLTPAGQLRGVEEPDRCPAYWRMARQAHGSERGDAGFREVQQRMRVHLRHCAACCDWFVINLSLGEEVDEPAYGNLPALETAAAAMPASKPAKPTRRPDWCRTLNQARAQRLSQLYVSLGRTERI